MEKIEPFAEGTGNFDYWCRKSEDGLFIFFANPKSQHLVFPLEYGQSLNDKKEQYEIVIHYNGSTIPVTLEFNPYQSLLLKIDNQNKVSFIDKGFTPKTPVYQPRVKKGKERWEVDRAGK